MDDLHIPEAWPRAIADDPFLKHEYPMSPDFTLRALYSIEWTEMSFQSRLKCSPGCPVGSNSSSAYQQTRHITWLDNFGFENRVRGMVRFVAFHSRQNSIYRSPALTSMINAYVRLNCENKRNCPWRMPGYGHETGCHSEFMYLVNSRFCIPHPPFVLICSNDVYITIYSMGPEEMSQRCSRQGSRSANQTTNREWPLLSSN
jgi:hypothetical protein